MSQPSESIVNDGVSIKFHFLLKTLRGLTAPTPPTLQPQPARVAWETEGEGNAEGEGEGKEKEKEKEKEKKKEK